MAVPSALVAPLIMITPLTVVIVPSMVVSALLEAVVPALVAILLIAAVPVLVAVLLVGAGGRSADAAAPSCIALAKGGYPTRDNKGGGTLSLHQSCRHCPVALPLPVVFPVPPKFQQRWWETTMTVAEPIVVAPTMVISQTEEVVPPVAVKLLEVVVRRPLSYGPSCVGRAAGSGCPPLSPRQWFRSQWPSHRQ